MSEPMRPGQTRDTAWTVERLFAAEARLRCAASKYSSTYGMHLASERQELRDAARAYAQIADEVEQAMKAKGVTP
jgi:hypothetical protein